MNDHTKGIWKLDQHGDVVHSCNGQVCVTGFALSCGPRNKEAEANARHIVHCVNNMPKVVEALRDMLDDAADNGYKSICTEQARTLLAALEAEKGGEL